MAENEERGGAVIAVAVGALIIGLAPIGLRLSEVGPQATAFWRFVFALPVLALGWAAWERGAAGPAPSGGLIRLLLVAGVFFGVELGLWHAALLHTSVVNATLLSNMTPIVAAGAGWLFLRERVSWGFAAGAGVAVAGAAALSFSRAASGTGAVTGDLLAIGSAFGYAAYLVLLRRARRDAGTLLAMVVTTIGAAGVSFTAALALNETILPQTATGWALLVGLGVLIHACGQGLIAHGVGKLPIALSTVLLWCQPIAAAAFAWAIFGEEMSPLGLLGAGMVLAGVWIVQTGSSRHSGRSAEGAESRNPS